MSAADLRGLIALAVRTELEIFRKKYLKKDSDIMTRKETAILLRIDLSTLWEWTDAGKLKANRIGRRVYYKRSEIEACFQTVTN